MFKWGENLTIGYQLYAAQIGTDYGFPADRSYYLPEKIELTMTVSARADYPIGLSFTGTTLANTQITSKGSVLLGHGIDSSVVTITTAGSLQSASSKAVITAATVSLKAGAGIGNADQPLPVVAASLFATTSSGDIYLDANRNSPNVPLTIQLLAAPGVVGLTAGGNIRGGTIQASGVSLVSSLGTIGTAGLPVRIQPFNSGPNVRFDGRAAGDLNINAFTGDLLVGTVSAPGGTVLLTAGLGSIYDANTWTVNPNRVVQIDAQFDGLRVLNDEQAIADAVTAFQAGVRAHYMRLWSLRGDSVVFDGRLQLRSSAFAKWSAVAAAGLGLPEREQPTDQQVLDYTANLYSQEENFFTRTIGADWNALAAFKKFDARWVYQPTTLQRDKLVADLGLDARSLIRLAGVDMGAATRPWDPAVRVGGKVNVTATNVFLNSYGGTVGRITSSVPILTTDFQSGILSETQKLELALAGQRGDATKIAGGFGRSFWMCQANLLSMR
jgi:hypothetical protein